MSEKKKKVLLGGKRKSWKM